MEAHIAKANPYKKELTMISTKARLESAAAMLSTTGPTTEVSAPGGAVSWVNNGAEKGRS